MGSTPSVQRDVPTFKPITPLTGVQPNIDENTKSLVAVTGATGFIGSHVGTLYLDLSISYATYIYLSL